MGIIKTYQKTFGHEVEKIVATFLGGIQGLTVEPPTEEEDQLGKVDLWVNFSDGCDRIGLQITCANDSQIVGAKEKELRYHNGVILVRVNGREVRNGQLTRTAGSSVVHQIWQGLNPARQQVLAATIRG